MTKIEVSRYQSFFSLKSYRYGFDVWVDGVKKDYVSRWGRRDVLIELTPGQHTLQVKTSLGIMVSKVTEFNINEGKTLYFKVQNNEVKVLVVLGAILAGFLLFMSMVASNTDISDWVMYFMILGPALFVNLLFKDNSFKIIETDSQGNEVSKAY